MPGSDTQRDTASEQPQPSPKHRPKSPSTEKQSQNHMPDVSKQKEELKITDLHLAAEEGDVGKVEDLLGNKESDLNSQDHEGMTALIIAVRNKNTDVVKSLLEKKPMLDIPDNTGKTALHWAAQSGNDAIIDQILSAKTNVTTTSSNPADDKGKRPDTEGEQESSDGANDDGDKASRDPAVNINMLDLEGHTPLYLASESGSIKAVDLLLQYGAHDRLPDKMGTMPIDAAAVAGKEDVAKLLRKARNMDSLGELKDLPPPAYFILPKTPLGEDLDLGSIINDLDTMEIRPKSENYEPPSDDMIWRKGVPGLRMELAQAKKGFYGPWAVPLGQRLISESNWEEGDVIEIGAIEDCFIRSPTEYLQRLFNRISKPSEFQPGYIVTGMKIVRDASFTKFSSTTTEANPGTEAVESNASAEPKQQEKPSSRNLVLAVCVWKIYYTRSIFPKRRKPRGVPYGHGAYQVQSL